MFHLSNMMGRDQSKPIWSQSTITGGKNYIKILYLKGIRLDGVDSINQGSNFRKIKVVNYQKKWVATFWDRENILLIDY